MNRKQNSLMRFSRVERLAQLSEQESVIERKKREIQAKIEAKRRKESEEALRKFEASNDGKKKLNHLKSVSSLPSQSLSSSSTSSSTSWKESGDRGDSQLERGREKPVECEKKESLKNAFSNDGSFLDQFKKLSQSGFASNTMDRNARSSEGGQIYNRNGGKDVDASTRFDLSQLPPPGVVELLPRQNVQNPQTSETPHTSVPVRDSNQSSHHGDRNSYQLPLPTPVPPPGMKTSSDSISMTFKSNNTKRLELTSNLLKDDDDEDDNRSAVHNSALSKDTSSDKTRGHVMSHSGDKESSRTLCNQEESRDLNRIQRLAEVVAQCGDDFEDVLRRKNENDPALGFLFNKDSAEYKSFRAAVSEHRRKMGTAENRLNSSDDEDDGRSSRNQRKFSHTEGTGEQAAGSSKSDRSRSRYLDAESERGNDGYQADSEDVPNYNRSGTSGACSSSKSEPGKSPDDGDKAKSEERRRRKRKSRWGDAVATSSAIQPPALVTNLNIQPTGKLPAPKTNLLSQLTRSDPGLIQYARQTFGSTNLSEEDWKKAEDHYKINLLYQDLVKKRAEIDKLERAGKFKYEYDSDEDVEGGTWEHKLRQQEMMATQLWAEELTRQAAGKHHIGDFLPPEELERFMERYNAVKEGREPDLSDYKEFKLKEDNVGYRLLQKMGWNEGQGLGQDGTGITHPVNKATTRHENQGLGVERPDGLEAGDDEYDAYRKRMMLAYRFRPNPLNNPRRPYY